MRMRKGSAPTSRLTILACTVFLTAVISAGSLRGAEENLPAKAKKVASQFAEFQKTANPQAIEMKRKQVIDYLGKILKTEAADANLDGALAVKELISKLSAKSNLSVATTLKPPSELPQGNLGRIAHLKDAQRLSTSPSASPTRFGINQESKRTLAFNFKVPAAPVTKIIRFDISAASDDSGDKGLHFMLVDPAGRVAKHGFLTSSDTVQVTHQTNASGGWQMLLQDEDTALDGAHPGNHGYIKVSITEEPAIQGPEIASQR